jgi:hypothetical protein
MDSFKELTPEEIRLATIQFMGQHLTGDLKVLDQHITNKTTSLQGLTIDPLRVINTIPGSQNPVANVVNAGINIAQPHINNIQPQHNLNVQTIEAVKSDPNQLEFDFDSSPYSKQIFEQLDRIERKLDTLNSILKKTPLVEKID